MLRTLTTETGIALTTEDAACELLADGHEAEPGVPARVQGVVYNRETGLLFWLSAAGADQYRIYEGDAAGSLRSLIASTDVPSYNAGVLDESQHRTFVVTGYSSVFGLEGPPSNPIHVAGGRARL